MLETGIKNEITITVTEKDTAIVHGSGSLPVFATPAMIALMEHAAMKAVAPFLPDGSTTVGCMIESTHLAPSYLGAEVSATALLERVEGRKLHFNVVANEGEKILGMGTHTRVIVDVQKFMEKNR